MNPCQISYQEKHRTNKDAIKLRWHLLNQLAVTSKLGRLQRFIGTMYKTGWCVFEFTRSRGQIHLHVLIYKDDNNDPNDNRKMKPYWPTAPEQPVDTCHLLWHYLRLAKISLQRGPQQWSHLTFCKGYLQFCCLLLFQTCHIYMIPLIGANGEEIYLEQGNLNASTWHSFWITLASTKPEESLEEIPKWIYKEESNKVTPIHFAYYRDDAMARIPPASEATLVELFAGAGGSHQVFTNYHNHSDMIHHRVVAQPRLFLRQEVFL